MLYLSGLNLSTQSKKYSKDLIRLIHLPGSCYYENNGKHYNFVRSDLQTLMMCKSFSKYSIQELYEAGKYS